MKKVITFLFLTFSAICFSQPFEDQTKITAYSFIDVIDDGPCSVLSYVRHNDFGAGLLQTAEVSDCRDFILELLKLKKESTAWTAEDCWCQEGTIGGTPVPYMLTIEYNKFRDTIFFTDSLRSVYNPKTQKEYVDPEGKIRRALSKDRSLKEFFETDFDKIFGDVYYFPENYVDSLSIDKLKKANLHGRSKKEVETLVGEYDAVKTFSFSTYNPDNPRRCEYECSKHNIDFYFVDDGKIDKVTIGGTSDMSNPEKAYITQILGIGVGDDEQKLRQKFPGSTKYIDDMRRYFRDPDGKYGISVKLTDKHGWVTYHLKDGKITDIEVAFQYWD